MQTVALYARHIAACVARLRKCLTESRTLALAQIFTGIDKPWADKADKTSDREWSHVGALYRSTLVACYVIGVAHVIAK